MCCLHCQSLLFILTQTSMLYMVIKFLKRIWRGYKLLSFYPIIIYDIESCVTDFLVFSTLFKVFLMLLKHTIATQLTYEPVNSVKWLQYFNTLSFWLCVKTFQLTKGYTHTKILKWHWCHFGDLVHNQCSNWLFWKLVNPCSHSICIFQ